MTFPARSRIARRSGVFRILSALGTVAIALPLVSCSDSAIILPAGESGLVADPASSTHGPSSPPDITPPPVGSSNINRDWRAGGADDIQAAHLDSFAEVGPPSGVAKYAHYQTYKTGFTLDVDGQGTHAVLFPLVKTEGLPSPEHQLNWGMVKGPSIDSRNNSWRTGGNPGKTWPEQSIYLQWKTRFGRTATGDGVADGAAALGDVGSFRHDHGHKWFVWFWEAANPEGFKYRLTMTHNTSTLYLWNEGGADDTKPFDSEPGHVPGFRVILGRSDGTGFWPHHYYNQDVTLTLRLKKASSNGVADGELQFWVNGSEIGNWTGLDIGGSEWRLSELILGGPTWGNVPQNQTMYVWDFVAWVDAEEER